MKHISLSPLRLGLVAVVLALAAGCGGQTRGSADADNQSKAVSPAEGGASSTQGDAGAAKNFGDTRAKTERDKVSPSASPTGMSKDASSSQPPPPVTPPPPDGKQ